MDGPHALALNERLLELLADAGLDPTDAARAAYLLIVYVFGSIALEVADSHQPGPLPPEPERIATRQRRLRGDTGRPLSPRRRGGRHPWPATSPPSSTSGACTGCSTASHRPTAPRTPARRAGIGVRRRWSRLTPCDVIRSAPASLRPSGRWSWRSPARDQALRPEAATRPGAAPATERAPGPRGDASTLTLVSAPAGFGKTTLLAEWLAAARGGRHGPWPGCRSTSGTTIRRCSGPTSSPRCGRRRPEVGAGALALLQSPQPSTEAVLATLLNDLAAVPDDVVLVLDDYHVIEARDVQEAMAFLLDHLPPQIHLVIATRADPPLPLARLRARGELVEIRAADLRFTPDEAAAYLNDVMGLHADGGRRRRAGGAHRGLDRRAPAGGALDAGPRRRRRLHRRLRRGRPLRRRLPGRGGAAASARARPQLPAADLHPGPAHAARCATPSPARTAARPCSRRWTAGNLFLVPLDDRRRWYRYHHLFADVLRARLLDEQPDRVRELHRRASDWYERNGDRSEAIDHALAAEDFERAADLVELAHPGAAPGAAGGDAAALARGAARRAVPRAAGAQPSATSGP